MTAELPATEHTLPADARLELLPLALLDESAWNPRKYFSESKLVELAESIRVNGLRTPILVRPRPQGRYEIGAGARRRRAAERAGLQSVPCIIQDMDDAAFLDLVSFENGGSGSVSNLAGLPDGGGPCSRP